MFRCVTAIALAWILIGSCPRAEAQQGVQYQQGAETQPSKHECWDNYWRDYHRNKMWPEPFLMADRQSVISPFATMVANGWRRQNLLSDYHFDSESNQLNGAGEMKVRFILTQMPPSRRTIFVQRGQSPDVTASRISYVDRAAARVAPTGAMAGIVESDLPNDGWPADEVEAVSRKFYKTQPDPRLKSLSGADQSSAGSGNSN
jgi:hypothetical protein